MVKNITAASTDQWLLIDTARDTYNVVSNYLFPNTSGAEGSLALSDFNSNGFKIRSTNSICNSNTNTYIFAAFAEAPFKYARAR